MSNLELVERCVAAYLAAGQPSRPGDGAAAARSEGALAAQRATLAYVAAAHRLAASALPPKRPSRMRRQAFDFWLPSPTMMARSLAGVRPQRGGLVAAGGKPR